MSDAAPAPDSDEAVLARMVARCDAAAERVHAKLMAAEETAEIAELVRAGQRLDRSLRQALLLKAKLARDPRERPSPDPEAVAARKTELRRAVAQVIRLETEAAEAPEQLAGDLAELELHLDLESRTPDFLTAPLNAVILRLCAGLDWPPPEYACVDPFAPPPPTPDTS